MEVLPFLNYRLGKNITDINDIVFYYNEDISTLTETGYAFINEEDIEIKRAASVLSVLHGYYNGVGENIISPHLDIIQPVVNKLIANNRDMFVETIDAFNKKNKGNIWDIIGRDLYKVYDLFWKLICNNGFEDDDLPYDAEIEELSIYFSFSIAHLNLTMSQEGEYLFNVIWVCSLEIVRDNLDEFRELSNDVFWNKFFNSPIGHVTMLFSMNKYIENYWNKIYEVRVTDMTNFDKFEISIKACQKTDFSGKERGYDNYDENDDY